MEEIKILGKISQTTIEIIFSFPGNYTIAVQFFAKLRSHLSNYLRQYQVATLQVTLDSLFFVAGTLISQKTLIGESRLLMAYEAYRKYSYSYFLTYCRRKVASCKLKIISYLNKLSVSLFTIQQ